MNRRFLDLIVFEWLVLGISVLVFARLVWPTSFHNIESTLLEAIGAGEGVQTYLRTTGYMLLVTPFVICAYASVAHLGSSLLARLAQFLVCSVTVLLLVFLGLVAASL